MSAFSIRQASLPGRERGAGLTALVVGTDYLRTVATMDRLRETLRDEHSCLVQFMLTVWQRCLTPFQAANLHIQARPAAGVPSPPLPPWVPVHALLPAALQDRPKPECWRPVFSFPACTICIPVGHDNPL